MSEKVQLKGGICEFDFGYNAKMEGYAHYRYTEVMRHFAWRIGRINKCQIRKQETKKKE